MVPTYDQPASFSDTHVIYDLDAGVYAINVWTATSGGVEYVDPLSEQVWSPLGVSQQRSGYRSAALMQDKTLY